MDSASISTISEPASPRQKGHRSLKILLVDDEENIRSVLKEYFHTDESHSVVTAADGYQALRSLEMHDFDCAFLDLKMPGMSGVELLSRIKQRAKELPVVIMTGYPSLDVAVDAMRQGASDFLVKPFSLAQVQASLERVVREQRLLKENMRLSAELRQKNKIDNLNRELQRRIHQQNIIRQISEATDRLHTSEALYQGMADLSGRFLDAEKAAVLLLDRSQDQLLIIAVHGFSPDVVGKGAGKLGVGVCGKVAAEGEPMMGNPGSDPAAESLLPTSGPYFVLPIKIRAEVFGVMLVGDKRGGLPFRGEDIFVARFLLDKAALSIENIALYESMITNLHSTLGALVHAMEAKDPYTRRHSYRVTNLSVQAAQAMGLGIEEIESIRFAAYLHDIGKIGIKDYVLQKQSRLTPEEYEHIKQHPVLGKEIVKGMDLSEQERSIICHHHERWDGTGYPDGLKEREIPLLARIVAVADAYDAMTSDRPYRKAKSYQEAERQLKEGAGTQFDPDVVVAFCRMLTRYHGLESVQGSGAG